ncbi:MAG: alanine--glyoxylate aminotransferase family protein [Elusimicrobia bacterium]|nr:alanine--glyoxylate aminotransferase family protein [Elusimicrobiota bacterium]
MENKPSILLTPGPTPVPEEVLRALSQPIIHHRTEEFGKLFETLLADLRYCMRTKGRVLALTSSGTGAMECAVANLLSPGDKAVVHATGIFGDRFVEIVKAYGLNPVVISEEWGRAASPERLAAALRTHRDAKVVFVQHTDTSTGVVNDLKALSAVARAESEAVLVVDAISGLGGEPLETDLWGLDVVLSASQKGLMNAPGLSFMSVSDRAWARVEKATLPRYYFDWRAMDKSIVDRETPFTPAVALVAGQVAAFKLIREEGIENVWKRTLELARYAREKGSALGLEMFPKDPCNILTAFRLPAGLDGKKLIQDILREEKISIAGGQGPLAGKIIRVAHMGHIGKPDLDAGFEALAKRLPVPASLKGSPSGALKGSPAGA